MTVKDLKELLEKYNEDMEVRIGKENVITEEDYSGEMIDCYQFVNVPINDVYIEDEFVVIA